MNGNSQKRRNWTYSLTIVVLVAAAAAILGYIIAPPIGKADRAYLVSSAGNVLFDHGKHSEKAESCAQCHHNLYDSTFAVSCSDCHDDDMDADDFEHTELKSFHERDCSKCHEQVENNTQATSCRECHLTQKDSNEQPISCSDCHEDYTPDIMEHDEYLEIEDHSCLTCHTPTIVSEAYHTNCTRCHLEYAPKRFADNDGKTVCGACHLR